MVFLGLFLSLGILGGIPTVVEAKTGMTYDGLYYFVIVDTFVYGGVGGTITGLPDGVPEDTGYWGAGTVAGQHGFFTNTRASMAGGYAVAPLDFWLTAVPSEGYSFVGWSNVSGGWVSGNQVHIQYSELIADAYYGWYQPTAMFSPISAVFDFKATTGIVYDSPSGIQTIESVGVFPVACHVHPSYTALWEFGGWIGSTNLIYKMDDPSSASTFIIMTPAAWWIGSDGYWCQPTLKAKLATEYDLTFTEDPVGHGTFTSDNEQLQRGEAFNQTWDDTDGAGYGWEFKNWTVSAGVACSDYFNSTADFWLTGEAGGTAVAHSVDSAVSADLWILTMAKTGYGTTSPTTGDHIVLSSQVIALKAMPTTGWVFDSWLGLTDGRSSSNANESIRLSENTTVTAVFKLQSGGPDEPNDPVITGIWGGISDTLSTVGLDNPMGRMMVVLAGMVIVGVMAGKNKYMRVAGPLGILGIGIVGFWVPIWIVILLAIGVGVGLLGWFGRKTAA